MTFRIPTQSDVNKHENFSGQIQRFRARTLRYQITNYFELCAKLVFFLFIFFFATSISSSLSLSVDSSLFLYSAIEPTSRGLPHRMAMRSDADELIKTILHSIKVERRVYVVGLIYTRTHRCSYPSQVNHAIFEIVGCWHHQLLHLPPCLFPFLMSQDNAFFFFEASYVNKFNTVVEKNVNFDAFWWKGS